MSSAPSLNPRTAPGSVLPPFVRFDRVSYRYGDTPALVEVSFALERGEFVLLTGASGAGKSTVIRLAAGLLRPESGEVEIAGEGIDRLPEKRLAWLRRSMGVILQDALLLSDRSVLDNVMLPALAAELSVAEARERALAALSRCGVDQRAADRPSELSGGEQQRVALARAVVNRPALILADEPTAHLDALAASELLALLSQFASAGVSVLLASHHSAPPPGLACRIIKIASGQVVA